MTSAQQQPKKNKKAKTAITPTREENFPQWYQNVIKEASLAENSPVRGCMIIKPDGYGLWENIQRALDDRIKLVGVRNAYFPLLIPLNFLSREAEHVDGFAKECAVVTHHRLVADEENGGLKPDGELDEPLVIRPTSETIIGDAMSRWVQSYRDLPLKLNQWCNVMRWEMRTRMFLRTAEFLWQEGHNAFETEEQASDDTLKMLNVYADLFEQDLAMPVIKGEKTADERFPGAVSTLTVESMMQDGKALQSGTSHYLGQNFARSLDIKFQGRDGQDHLCHTTSWGVSTRSIGGVIMTHGDDDGMIMPPNVAPFQIVIIPIVRDDKDEARVTSYCQNLQSRLQSAGLRCDLDLSENRTSNKMWGAIKKGIPLRVEVGGREVDDDQVTFVRRDIGRDSKETCSADQFINKAPEVLKQMQSDLLAKARSFMDSNIHTGSGCADIEDFFKAEKVGFVKTSVSILEDPDFENLKQIYSLTPRCLPLEDEGQTVIIGKSY